MCIGNRVLWEGESHMGADHYIDLPEGINEQATGIVLVFSPYNGTAIQTHNYKTFFIPKYMVEVQGGMGYSFFLTSNDLKSIGTKYIYISNKRLSGNAVGIGSGTTNGITYDSAKWCLRYVIGV